MGRSAKVHTKGWYGKICFIELRCKLCLHEDLVGVIGAPCISHSPTLSHISYILHCLISMDLLLDILDLLVGQLQAPLERRLL